MIFNIVKEKKESIKCKILYKNIKSVIMTWFQLWHFSLLFLQSKVSYIIKLVCLHMYILYVVNVGRNWSHTAQALVKKHTVSLVEQHTQSQDSSSTFYNIFN